MSSSQWPKIIPELTPEQKVISDDFMHYWHEVLPKKYGMIEKFNHMYPVKHAPKKFKTTLEIGAGLGEHIHYEHLTESQEKNYVAQELRQNMIDDIALNFPRVQTCKGSCEERLPFKDGYFDRIIAVHVLEHLPNLPQAVKEMHRLCNKKTGVFSVVIPCEGGFMYTCARRVSAQRIFEKRYKQKYEWFISREHINRSDEIIKELEMFFTVEHKSYFPFKIPLVHLNLVIGLTLRPK